MSSRAGYPSRRSVRWPPRWCRGGGRRTSNEARLGSRRMPGVDLEWQRGFAERYLAAWNSHEPERLFALMTDDVIYDDAAWPERMHGHDEVRPFLASIWRAFPDLELEVVEGPFLLAGAPKVAHRWR